MQLCITSLIARSPPSSSSTTDPTCLCACHRVFAVGLRAYLRSSWNKLDMLVTALSIVNVLVENLAASATGGASTQFLPVLRTLRVARVFRLVKSAKGMRKLLRTLYW